MSVARHYAGANAEVECTSGLGLFRTRSPDFVCIVHRSATVCDRLDVRRSGTPATWHVRVLRRGVDCVLPA